MPAGQSVRGNVIPIITLAAAGSTDDDQLEQKLKPEIRYLGGIHGNELPSTFALVKLAHQLACTYSSDATVTALLQSTTVHIIPVLNPGWEICDSPARVLWQALEGANTPAHMLWCPDAFEDALAMLSASTACTM